MKHQPFYYLTILTLLVLNLDSFGQHWVTGGNTSAGIDGVTTSNNFLGSSSGNSVDIKIGTNGNTVMTLTSGGNLGIGTASPAQLLDVNGNINVATDQWYGIDGNRILANEGFFIV